MALSSRFWQRKMDEYEALKVEIEALKLHVKKLAMKEHKKYE
jgi:hypothetical protein